MAQIKPLQALEVQAHARKGQQLYDNKLRAELEKEHPGKYVAIDVESGEYFLGKSVDDALQQAEQHHPDELFHVVRIGHRGVHAVRREMK